MRSLSPVRRVRIIACIAVLVSWGVIGQALAAPIGYVLDANGNIIWGGDDKTDKNPMSDLRLPRQQTGPGHLDFYWTKGTKVVANPDKPGSFLVTYEPVSDFQRVLENNTTQQSMKLKIYRPDDKNAVDKITGWAAQTTDGLGYDSKILAGNIKKGSPWAFAPLDELPPVAWKIPVFGQVSGTIGPTIYTAINLPLYLEKNPFGPDSGAFNLDSLLDDLGSIVNGELFTSAGHKIEGIYFATSDWGLDTDPNSVLGYYPLGGISTLLNSSTYEAQYGSIGVMTIFQAPEPPSLALLAGSLGMLWLSRRMPTSRKAGLPG